MSTEKINRVENAQPAELELEGVDAEQYLTFIMDKEEYGVNILIVQEIRGWESATPIPNAPDYIRGVINLRGTIVPITDLRQRFGMELVDYSELTVVIVLKVETKKGSRIIGIVVDAVSDVYTIAKSDMKSPPDFGENSNTEFVKSLVSVNDSMIILLDIDKLMDMDGIPNLSKMPAELSDSNADASSGKLES